MQDAIEMTERGQVPPNVAKDANDSQAGFLYGWRRYAVMSGLLMAIFLGNLETTIVNTALVSISNDLGDYDKASWIVSSYLLGFVGVVIINAKLSDIFGRRALLITTFSIFAIFSAACGAAQTAEQLIIFRSLKDFGLGGAGLVSLPAFTAYDVVPLDKLPKYASIIGLDLALVTILGPILGGAITNATTWRWVFLINVPIAIPFMVLLAIAIPRGFPYQNIPNRPRRSWRMIFARETLGRIDFPGSLLLLIGTVFFVAAFQQAGKTSSWSSGFVVSLIVLSGVVWICFAFYERHISVRQENITEPVFPWRFVKNRAWIGMLIVSFFHGSAWIIPIYQIPQSFQVLYGYSPLQAAVRLLPFTTLAPLSMIISSALAKKGYPPIYFLLFTTLLQVLGFALLGTLPYSDRVLSRQYGFQIIAGFGAGPMLTLLHLIVPFIVEPRDRGVGSGALTQARYMGAVLGLSIVTTAMNNLVRTRVGDFLPRNVINGVLESPEAIAMLLPMEQELVRSVFADGFNVQMKILAGLTGGEVLGCLMMWKREQIKAC